MHPLKTRLHLTGDEALIVKWALRDYRFKMQDRAKHDHIDMEPWLRDAQVCLDLMCRTETLIDRLDEREEAMA